MASMRPVCVFLLNQRKAVLIQFKEGPSGIEQLVGVEGLCVLASKEVGATDPMRAPCESIRLHMYS